MISFKVIEVTIEAFLLNDQRFGQASFQACPNSSNFGKKFLTRNCNDFKTKNHASTANIIPFLICRLFTPPVEKGF